MAVSSLPLFPSNLEPRGAFGRHVSFTFFSLDRSLSLFMTFMTLTLLKMLDHLLEQASIWVHLIFPHD